MLDNNNNVFDSFKKFLHIAFADVFFFSYDMTKLIYELLSF
jgi:hypothetical protein